MNTVKNNIKLKIPQYSRYEHRIGQTIEKKFERRFVLISDSHISLGNNPAFNEKMWHKAIEEINKIKNVDYIVHFGDLTHDGTYLEYQKALELLKPINDENFHIIPGNHDSRNVGYKLFEDYFGHRTFEINDENLMFLGVDSSEPDEDWGVLGKAAIQKSKKDLMKAQDKIKLYAFHHQLLPIPNTGRERSAIWDSGDVLGMLLECNVNIVINGHRHISNVYTCTDGDCDLTVFNCGTISSNKTRYNELFSYTIMDISDSMVNFTMKTTHNGGEIIRGRYINQVFREKSDEIKTPCCTIVHLGNTHFGEGKFDQFLYYQAMAQINELNPDLVIHTGSLTYKNQPEEYKLATKYLSKIKPKTLVLPGFRDLRKYGWTLFPKEIGAFEPYFKNKCVTVMGVNAVNPNIPNGKIGRSRMAEITEHFSKTNRSKFNIIATNSRLVPSPKLKYDKILNDAGDILDEFTLPDHKIDIIFSGKNNLAYALQVEDTILSLCGTICSEQAVELDNYSYNVLNLYKNGFVEVLEHDVKANQIRTLGNFWTKARINGKTKH